MLNYFEKIYCNNYFNPYTVTFSNPLTYEMVDIIVLYHYVMAFLIFIVLLTFFFIFLSLRQTIFMYEAEYNYYLKQSPWNILKIYKNIFLIEELETNEGFKKWVASRRITHASILEFLWIVLPIIILGFIIYPSIMLLYSNENFADPILNVSVIGNQWFWTYEYNDFHIPTMFKFYMEQEELTGFWKGIRSFHELMQQADVRIYNKSLSSEIHDWHKEFNLKAPLPERISFDSNLIIAKDTSKFPRLLTTDNVLVLPTKTPIRLLITSNDVIHSWAVPSYGVKVDAIPGRINQQILFIPLMGRAWGQCSELCGVNHGFMPIEIKTLPRPEFNYFIYLKFLELTKEARKEYFCFQYKTLVNDVRFMHIHLKALMQLTSDPELVAIFKPEMFVRYVLDYANALEFLVKGKNPLILNLLEKKGLTKEAIMEVMSGEKSLIKVVSEKKSSNSPALIVNGEIYNG